jgi:hypothetical protein
MSLARTEDLPSPSGGDPPPRPCRKYRHLTVDSAVQERERMEAQPRNRRGHRRLRVYHCRPCTVRLGRDVYHVGHEKEDRS